MYSMFNNIVIGNFITQTEKAVLVAIDGDYEHKLWIPISVIDNFAEYYDVEQDDEIELEVQSWFCKKHEL